MCPPYRGNVLMTWLLIAQQQDLEAGSRSAMGPVPAFTRNRRRDRRSPPTACQGHIWRKIKKSNREGIWQQPSLQRALVSVWIMRVKVRGPASQYWIVLARKVTADMSERAVEPERNLNHPTRPTKETAPMSLTDFLPANDHLNYPWRVRGRPSRNK